MPLGKILKKIIGPDLITSVWRIREPQTEKKNLHFGACRAILVIAPFRVNTMNHPYEGIPPMKNEPELARHPDNCDIRKLIFPSTPR
jgi:hypothetical protein